MSFVTWKSHDGVKSSYQDWINHLPLRRRLEHERNFLVQVFVECNEIRSCETADDADDDESDDFLRIERKFDAKISAKKRSQRIFVLPKDGENAEDEGGHDRAEKGAPVVTNGEICRSDFDREKHAADRSAETTAHADSASSTEANK